MDIAGDEPGKSAKDWQRTHQLCILQRFPQGGCIVRKPGNGCSGLRYGIGFIALDPQGAPCCFRF